MKRIFYWMMAAVLICGTTSMFTACGDDDDNNVVKPEPPADDDPDDYPIEPTFVKAGVYDVSVAYLVHPSMLKYCDVELTVTDFSGNQSKFNYVTGEEQTETLTAEEQQSYEAVTEKSVTASVSPNLNHAFFAKALVRHFTYTGIAVDKTLKFSTYIKMKEGVEFTDDVFQWMLPSVIYKMTPKDNPKANVILKSEVRFGEIKNDKMARFFEQNANVEHKSCSFILTVGDETLNFYKYDE